MAQEAGIDKGQVSDHELGKAAPSPRLRRRYAKALRVDVDFIEEWLLPQCRTIRLAFDRAAGEAQSEADTGPGSSPQPDSELIGRVTEAVAPFILGLDHLALAHVPSSEDRSWAEMQWRKMEPLSAEDQILVIEVLQDERSWALAERLCEESSEAASDRADEALRLARLAIHAAKSYPGAESRRVYLLGYCHDFEANALRVQGDLEAAEKAFDRAEQYRQQSQGNDLRGWLDDTRRSDLRASLLRYQGHHSDALALLEEALKSHPSDLARGRLLAKKATTLELIGEYERALRVLLEAQAHVSVECSPRLCCVLLFNQAVNLCHLDRHEEAEILLSPIRALSGGKELDRIRVRWLEGRTWLGLGRREDALAALSEVRHYFQTEKIDYDFALVTLELAVLHLEEGRTQLVRELAEEMFWIFERQKVHKEALAALTLFRRAVQLEEARAEWTRRLIKYLYQAQHNPGLRFEA